MLKSVRLIGALMALCVLGACGPNPSTGSATLASDAAATTDSAYYMIVFGFQDGLNQPRNSHTFATFVRAAGDATAGRVESQHTISWMPKDLDIFLLQRPEPGVNLTLAQSLQLAAPSNIRLRRSRVYEITPELYAKARERIAFLERGAATGETRYTVLDGRWRGPTTRNQPGGASNCIHALSDIGGVLDTGTLRGFAASERVLDHLWPSVRAPGVDHEWVAGALGI